MSYDLQVWSVSPLKPNAFRKPEIWEITPGSWTHSREKCQIVVLASDRVEPEDVPEEISTRLPGIAWLTNLNVEGNATGEALRLAQSTATDIARSSHGVVFDQQDGSIRLPSGIKRLVLPRSKEAFDVISMSWWFLDSPIESRDGRERLVSLFERTLPEALPKRYGLYEPPQHHYAKSDREHFLRFLDENLHDMTVWYPHRPVVSVYLHLPNPRGAHKLGFRTNHLHVEIEKNALSEPGWVTNLKWFWRQVSVLVKPIYGDVRILGGYKWMGATVSGGQRHPVKAWWWAGIPENLGNAVVLGSVYQNLWPAFASAADVVDGLAFTSLEDWMANGDLVEKVGNPPKEQLQQPERFKAEMNAEEFREYMVEVRRVGPEKLRRQYPSGWPFEDPFAS